jgi:hypothetical protein
MSRFPDFSSFLSVRDNGGLASQGSMDPPHRPHLEYNCLVVESVDSRWFFFFFFFFFFIIFLILFFFFGKKTKQIYSTNMNSTHKRFMCVNAHALMKSLVAKSAMSGVGILISPRGD